MSLKQYLCHPATFSALVVIIVLLLYYVHKTMERLSEELKACNERHAFQNHNAATGDMHADGQTQTESRDEENTPREQESFVPSAPPLTATTDGNNYNNSYDPPPPPYNEVVTSKQDEIKHRDNGDGLNRFWGSNDLEWQRVFDAFNEKRMDLAMQWTPAPAGRALEKCLNKIDNFLNAESHPVTAHDIYEFLKSFVALTNLVYAEATGEKKDDAIISTDTTLFALHRAKFLQSFRLLLNEYVPKEVITDRRVPFGYDWFIFSGRMTYAIINAHIVLCIIDGDASSSRPYFSAHPSVNTQTVVRGLKNICPNFTQSLGYERYSSNRVYVGAAFLYASLLERAFAAITTDNRPFRHGGSLPNYTDTLNEILSDPSSRYEPFKTLIDDIGKSTIPFDDKESDAVKKGKRKKFKNSKLSSGAERGAVTYDGIYGDRSFFAHRRLRMYAYIRSYCEQLPSMQLLFRERKLDDEKIAVLLRTVEPMSDKDALFYFNLHSRTGGYKYRNGSALFSALGLSKFRTNKTGTSYGNVYVADKARILFVQSEAFTFHSIGQLSDLAYGEVEKSNQDLMPAWLMGQRPLFRSEKNKLMDVPCSAHLEPCVIDTGKSKGLKMAPIKQRNTTDYTPTEASSALVAFEEQCIGAVYTSVRETNMDVHYNRCTVSTQYFTLVTYFRITRNEPHVYDEKTIRLSCYTGCFEQNMGPSSDSLDTSFDFKHCTVQLFLQTLNGAPYRGASVTVENTCGVEKRPKSKTKYLSGELKNLSLLVVPYGHVADTNSPSSITIVFRPKDSRSAPLPKSFQKRKLFPKIKILETNVYRMQLTSRYVLYCDNQRAVMVMVDVKEKRACISTICSSLQDDQIEINHTDVLERASYTAHLESLGTLVYDTCCNNRLYAYFEDS